MGRNRSKNQLVGFLRLYGVIVAFLVIFTALRLIKKDSLGSQIQGFVQIGGYIFLLLLGYKFHPFTLSSYQKYGTSKIGLAVNRLWFSLASAGTIVIAASWGWSKLTAPTEGSAEFPQRAEQISPVALQTKAAAEPTAAQPEQIKQNQAPAPSNEIAPNKTPDAEQPQNFSSGPSFDCAKATTIHENLICSNLQLSQADRALAEAYEHARAVSTNKAALRDEQKSWLINERNRCQSIDCMLLAYHDQTEKLLSISAQQGTPADPP